jgi:hypothetical protein
MEASRIAVTALAALMMVGCHEQIRPPLMYQDTNHPLSDTAVFTAFNHRGTGLGQILSIDGVPTSCWKAGCPFWARVLPGTHTFKLLYAPVLRRGMTAITIEMKPSHVYEVEFIDNGETFEAVPADLGEKPNYTYTVGLAGIHQQTLVVDF